MEDMDELSEEVYQCIRRHTTKEQMGEVIHHLLSSPNASKRVQAVAIRMAQIFTAKEGH